MELFAFFKSVLEEDRCAVVLCDTEHRIVYMNPAACARYQKWGGATLIGRSLLDCHNAASCERIAEVLAFFGASTDNNRVHTYYNGAENKDVYMVALRDDKGALIGYYEKHEYRDHDLTPLYEMIEK